MMRVVSLVEDGSACFNRPGPGLVELLAAAVRGGAR
jgi:hypothetical protein